MPVDKELQLWRNALTSLENGEECALLVVVHSEGSSPGRAGFKALITSNGALHGSIGGGSMEHKLVELAKARMNGPSSKTSARAPGERRVPKASAGSPAERVDPATTSDRAGSCEKDPANVFPFLKRQVHRADEPSDRSGMICSGEQTVAFFHLDGTVRSLVERIVEQLGNERTIGLHLGPHGLRTGDVPGPGTHGVLEHATDGSWSYRERLGTSLRIVILGAGHVGLALSRTMNQLGFHVHLMDDRADLNTMAANLWAHQRTVVDYERIGELIDDDPELYVVLVSFGYRTDDTLVRQLIRKRFKYLGMMGSEEKIKTLTTGLRMDGFTEEEIAKLKAPIGLPIGSKTPEEIAVSIGAEIIGVKNSIGP